MSQLRTSMILDGDARGLTAALQRGEAGFVEFGKAVRRSGNDLKSAKASADVFTQSLANEKRAFDQLRQSIDPVYRSSKQYEAVVNEVQRAVTTGTATQAEANRMLALAEAQYLSTGQAAATMSRQSNVAAGAVGNVFAQFNDIGMMAMAGQNPLQLAIQQGTQLNQVFATLGNSKQIFQVMGRAIMSMVSPISLVTLGVIAGGAALVQWGINAFTAEEKTDALTEAIKALKEEAEDARTKVRMFFAGADSAEELKVLDQIAQLDEKIARARAEFDAIGGGYHKAYAGKHVLDLQAERQALVDLLEERERAVLEAERLDERVKTAESSGERLRARLEARQQETEAAEDLLRTLEQQASLNAMIALFGEESAAVARLRLQHEREIFVEQTNSRDIADELKSELIAAWDAANGLASTDMASGISAAATQAERMAAALGIAVSSAIALTNTTPEMQDEDAVMSQNVLPNAADRARQRKALENLNNLVYPKKKRRSGRGGSGASEIKKKAREHERAVRDIERYMSRLAPTYARDKAALEKWKSDSLGALDPTKKGYKAFAKDVEDVFNLRLEEARRKDLQRQTSWAAGVERGFLEINEDMMTWANVGENLAERWSSGLEDKFVQLNRTGKFEIGDLVDYTLEQFARLAYQQAIQPAMEGIFGSLTGMIGGLFPGGASTAAGGATVTQSHAGSTIGTGGVRRTYGAGAPMRRDERLAVLTAGQRVFTPEQISNGAMVVDALAAAASASAAPGSVAVSFAPEITIVNQSGQALQGRVEDKGERSGRRRFQVVLSEQVGQSLRTPGSAASRELEARGVARQGTVR